MPRLIRILPALALCLLAGCVDQTTEGKTTVYTLALWTLGVPVLLGLFLVAVGIYTRDKGRLTSYGIILLGLLCMTLGPWMIRMDRVEVDDDHFTSSHGLPWDRVKHDLRFDDLREIQFEVTETKSRTGGSRKSYVMLCQPRAGGVEKVPIGTVMEAAAGKILGTARKKGVQLIGDEQLPADLRPR